VSDKQEEGLEPIEEKVVEFYEDELVAVRVEDGTIFVPVRRLCENLGVAWTPQWQRIQRNEVLAEAVKSRHRLGVGIGDWILDIGDWRADGFLWDEGWVILSSTAFVLHERGVIQWRNPRAFSPGIVIK
jgi:hypothetical protein